MKLLSGTARSVRWQQCDRMSTNKGSGSTDMTVALRTIRTMCISLLISIATGKSIQSAFMSLRLSLASEQVPNQTMANLLEEGILLLPPPMERPRILQKHGVCSRLGLACQLSWQGSFQNGPCSGHRMLFEQERNYALGMDSLVAVCS